MRIITLSAMTNNEEAADAIHEDFFEMSKNLSRSGQANVTVSSYIEEEEAAIEKVHYDDETMWTVREAMGKTGLKATSVEEIINNLQNAGILFRERAKES